MSTELTTTPPKSSALSVMASRFSVDPKRLLETLKNTVFKGASDDEMMTLVVVANEYGLNPLTKEIYAFPAKGGGIVPVVSIDGWLRMMNDHPQFDGIEFEFMSEAGKLISCTAIIHRKDRTHPICVTEYLSECRRNTEPWKMEHRMLRHKATIQCARVAFGFSGITDEDEAVNTPGIARDVTPKAEASKLFRPKTPTVEDCPQPPVYKSLAQSETADSPSTTLRDGCSSVPQNESAAFSLSDEPVSQVDQIMSNLAAHSLNWSQVLNVLQTNGIGGDEYISLADAPADVLTACLAKFDDIVNIVKGVKP